MKGADASGRPRREPPIGTRPTLTEIGYGLEIYSAPRAGVFTMNSRAVTIAGKQWLPRRAASLRQPL
jgi:hypothetical protein